MEKGFQVDLPRFDPQKGYFIEMTYQWHNEEYGFLLANFRRPWKIRDELSIRQLNIVDPTSSWSNGRSRRIVNDF